MDLRWPAIRDQTPAVHFRIPKEDMDISRLRGDRPGEVHVVFLHIRIPEQLAKNLYERVPNHGEFKPKPDRKFVRTVELLRIPNDAYMRTQRFERWSLSCRSDVLCVVDEGVSGMDRFSEAYCASPLEPSDLMTENSSDAWRERVLVPKDCHVVRSSSYLSNSVAVDKAEEGVDVWCGANMCNMHLQVNGREVAVRIRESQLEYAQEIAIIIRDQIKQYVIPQG